MGFTLGLDNVVFNIVQKQRQAASAALGQLSFGVEDKKLPAFLLEEGCDVIQGYFFSPPLTPADFAQLLLKIKCNPGMWRQETIRAVSVLWPQHK